MKSIVYIIAITIFFSHYSLADEKAVIAQNNQMIDKIKSSIKPVELNELSHTPNAVIRYELPKTTLTSTLGDTKIHTSLNVVVSETNQSADRLIDLKNSAYKAALMGQSEAALHLYKEALNLESDNLNTIFALGTLYHNLHQIEEAKAMYKSVLDIDPSHPKAINNYIALMSEDSPMIALKELRALETSNPEYAPVLAQIGMIHANLKQYPEAEIYLRRAIAEAPEVLNYRYNLAVLYDKVGLYEPAAKVYRQVAFAYSMGSNIPQSLESIQHRIQHMEAQLASSALS